jgi:two-component system, response regulator, stage 0 sporulation protein F
LAKILIVEDDANQRLLYRETFEEEGLEVIEAPNASIAIECVGRECLDLVVLDINMPGMDGLEALVRIHNSNRRLPVVIHSAYGEYRNQYKSWIADGYVIKSSNLAELKRTVLTLLDDARGDA